MELRETNIPVIDSTTVAVQVIGDDDLLSASPMAKPTEKLMDEKGHSLYDFEHLKVVEKLRRKLLHRSNDHTLLSLLQFRHTILYYVVIDIGFWLSLLIYFVTRYVEIDTLPSLIPGYTFLPVSALPVTFIGGAMSFILVFYVSQCYSRYTTQYDITKSMTQDILRAVTQGQASLSEVMHLKLWRYLNTVHILCYVGLSEYYNEDNFFNPLNQQWKLLTPREVERLEMIGMENSPQCVQEVTSWLIQMIKGEKVKGAITEKEMGDFMNYIFQIRASVGRLFSFADGPMPFAYWHYLNLMSFIFLPLFAYTVALQNRSIESRTPHEVIPVVAVILNCVWIIGLKVLGKKMQDPFGKDIEDLSVLHFCIITLVDSSIALHPAKFSSFHSSEEDDRLEKLWVSQRPDVMKIREEHSFRVKKKL